MELETVGQQNAVGYRVPLWANQDEKFDPDLGQGTRFRLIWAEKGSGILRLNLRSTAFMAPVLICLNEQERPCLEHQHDLKAQAFYFHPCVVNGEFDFENIRGPLESTDAQDRDWLWAFINRGAGEHNLLTLGPTTAQQVSRLFAAIQQELTVQRDGYWPCRARSFFLELLFLVDRSCMEPEAISAVPSSADTSLATGMGGMLMFLHAHYSEKITLQELSRVFHSNHTTLTQQFRKSTGQSIMPYLAQLRIRVASSILRDTTLPIAEIVQRVGFGDITHFGRTFRKYTGYTPSEYRQRYCRELHQV